MSASDPASIAREAMKTIASRQAAEPWPDPEPIERASLPPFPVDGLPADLRAWVEAVAEELQVPADLPAGLALAVISAALAGKVRVRLRDGWAEEAGLYVAVILPPAERKSPTVDRATAPVRAWERDAREREGPRVAEAQERRQIDERRLKSARGRAAEAKATADRIAAEEQAITLATRIEVEPLPVIPCLLTGHATAEALSIDLHRHAGRLAAIHDESGLLDNLAGRYNDGSANTDLVKAAYDGGRYSAPRVTREGVVIERATMALAFCVQPIVLDALTGNAQFRGGGFVGRFCFLLPRSRLGERVVGAPMSQALREAYDQRVRELLDLDPPAPGEALARPEGDPRCVGLAREAAEGFAAFERAHEPRLHPERGDLGAIGDWAGRHPGRIGRIALALHLFAHGRSGLAKPIDGKTMGAAIRVGDYLSAHALRALGGPGHEPEQTLLSWASRQGR